jgi:hypothetical protein
MATPHVAGSVALCIGEGQTAGPCAGLTPVQIVDRMRSDAAAHSAEVPTFGFLGDLASPLDGKYFGSLVWDGIIPPPPPASVPEPTPTPDPPTTTEPASAPAPEPSPAPAPDPTPAPEPSPTPAPEPPPAS